MDQTYQDGLAGIAAAYVEYSEQNPAKRIEQVPTEFLSQVCGRECYENQSILEISADYQERLHNKSIGVYYCTTNGTYYLIFDNRW